VRSKAWLLLCIVASFLLLNSCKASTLQAYYAAYDGEVGVIAVVDDSALTVVMLPWDVLSAFAKDKGIQNTEALAQLGGLKAIESFEADRKSLQTVKDLLTTLAIDTTEKSDVEIGDEDRLKALVAGAEYLRKTGLADTLASICPGFDLFPLLEGVGKVMVFDLTNVLEFDEHTDWQQMQLYIQRYVDEVVHYQRRSFIDE